MTKQHRHHRATLSLTVLALAAAAGAGCVQDMVVGQDPLEIVVAGECDRGAPGPVMARVGTPGGKAFCIDTTEVTQAQYAEFLAANPVPVPSSLECAWNDEYTPGKGTGLNPGAPECSKDNHFDPVGLANLPVVCVDWCDAEAYCAWAGKHLCGQIGGGPIGPDYDLDDEEASEWYAACSNGGQTKYPYGDGYDASKCNGAQVPTSWDVAPVGLYVECRGVAPFDAIVDMSGNVEEWQNYCPGFHFEDELPICQIRGGAYYTGWFDFGPDHLGCARDQHTWSADPRNTHRPFTGFRCCAD
jgi:sulfatase modifying factor 1